MSMLHASVCDVFPELRVRSDMLEPVLRNRASALNHAHQDDDYRYDQQYVNKSAQGVGTHHSQQPQDQEQGNDSPKHGIIPFWQTA
jgi:hypothetical protein